MSSAELKTIQDFVNQKIGVDMVQHGAEVYFADHSDDEIEVFSPTGQAGTLKGKTQIKKWYEYIWNRKPIDLKTQTLSTTILPASRIHISQSTGGIILGF